MRITWILSFLMSGVVLLGEPDSTTEADRQGLKFGIWLQDLPEMGRVTTGVLTAGKDAYLFMPPAHWEMVPDGVWGVRLIGSSRNSISIRVLPDAGGNSDRMAIEGLRVKAQGRLPEAKIVREMTCHTEGQSGPAYDLEWRDKAGAHFTTRIAYVEVGKRCFEFTLFALSEQFGLDVVTFAGLMTSFQLAGSAAGM